MKLVIKYILTYEDLLKYVEHLRDLVSDGEESLTYILNKFEDLLRLSSEEGEADIEVASEIKLDLKDYSRLFSKSITNIIDAISLHQPKSISKVAKLVKRDVINVYKDLKWLKELGLIDLVREGNALKPVIKFKEVCIRPE